MSGSRVIPGVGVLDEPGEITPEMATRAKVRSAWFKAGHRCGKSAAMAEAMRDAQASAVLDGLEAVISPTAPVILCRDEHGVAVVRIGSATWRGSSVRDALAQMLQSRVL
jgi:hypothetical protein